MTTIDQFHARVRRNVRDLTPKIAAAYLAGLAALLEMWHAEHALLSNRLYEQFIAEVLTDERIAAAFGAYRASLIDAIRDSMRFSARAIPGVTAAQVKLMPDILNPATLKAIQELDAAAMARLGDELRAMARAVFQQGGTATEVTARLYRSIGLGPSQVADVELFHTELLTRVEPLTAAQVEREVLRYSERRIASNVATNARTAALVAHKMGDQLAWQYVEDAGLVPDGWEVRRTWRQVPRPTRRASHAQMDGITVGLGERWPNGDLWPGAGDPWNCLCQAQHFMAQS